MASTKSKLAVGLDLGSTATRVVICLLQEDSLRFLGYGEAPVEAWAKSRLIDQEALTASIKFALHEAELRAQNVPTELVVYPDEGHAFRAPEHRRDVLERAAGWFSKYLPAEAPGS